MKALTRGRRHRVIHGQRRQRGWETPVPVCRDLIGLGLQYRLLPHMIAARFDHWCRCSTGPAIRRNGRAVTVANVRFCDRAPKNGRWSGALIPDRGSSPPRMTTQGRVCCDFV